MLKLQSVRKENERVGLKILPGIRETFSCFRGSNYSPGIEGVGWKNGFGDAALNFTGTRTQSRDRDLLGCSTRASAPTLSSGPGGCASAIGAALDASRIIWTKILSRLATRVSARLYTIGEGF